MKTQHEDLIESEFHRLNEHIGRGAVLLLKSGATVAGTVGDVDNNSVRMDDILVPNTSSEIRASGTVHKSSIDVIQLCYVA